MIGTGLAAPRLVATLGMHVSKDGARLVAIHSSCGLLLAFPYGTVAGAYSLWVLLPPETRKMFECP